VRRDLRVREGGGGVSAARHVCGVYVQCAAPGSLPLRSAQPVSVCVCVCVCACVCVVVYCVEVRDTLCETLLIISCQQLLGYYYWYYYYYQFVCTTLIYIYIYIYIILYL